MASEAHRLPVFRSTLVATILALAVCEPSIAFAQSSGLPPAVSDVLECQSAPLAQRLQCFEAKVASLANAIASRELVISDPSAAAREHRRKFGLTRDSAPSEELKRLETSLLSATVSGDGHTIFVLEDGSVWRSVERVEFPPPNHPRLPVHLERGTMGSYFLKVADAPAIRAHRMR